MLETRQIQVENVGFPGVPYTKKQIMDICLPIGVDKFNIVIEGKKRRGGAVFSLFVKIRRNINRFDFERKLPHFLLKIL